MPPVALRVARPLMLLFVAGSLFAMSDGRSAVAGRALGRLTPCEGRAEYRNNLGRAYAASGDLALAEEAFVQALTLRPDLPTAQANLAQVRELRARP